MTLPAGKKTVPRFCARGKETSHQKPKGFWLALDSVQGKCYDTAPDGKELTVPEFLSRR